LETRRSSIVPADSPAIDFLNSLGGSTGPSADLLANGKALLGWLAHTRLVPVAALDKLRRSSPAGELDAVAAQARDLREWFRGFVHRHKGRRLKPVDLRDIVPLTQVLERDESYLQIAKTGRGEPVKNSPLALRVVRRWRSAESLMIPIAQAIAELLCKEDFALLKSCQGPSCSFLFLDRTRGRARRWCSMDLCGNRAKQASYRKRSGRRKALSG
jgi:predicted RNA-binding Zn ribbon-like protein